MTRHSMIAAALVAAFVLPAAAAAQEMTPAREALRQAGHDLPTLGEREEQAARDRRVQRIWSGALIGVGGVAGGALAMSHNEWAFDEGWVGIGIAGVSLGFGLFGLFEPVSWRGIEIEPQGIASRRPHGAGSSPARGAALAFRW